MQETEVETIVQTDAEIVAPENAGETTSRFKTPEELLKAYENLEKEFTKRSQKLKVLEKELAEKTPSTVTYDENVWQKKVDDFFEARPEIAPFKKEIAEEILKSDLGNNENCLEIAGARVVLNNYKSPRAYLDDDDFVAENVLSNERIKDKIIRRYLSDLDGVKTVRTINAEGQPALAKQIRPKSVGEAGKMVMAMAGRGK